MDHKDSILKNVKDTIKDAAKAVEDFADKGAAPEEPVVIVRANDARPAKSPAPSDKG